MTVISFCLAVVAFMASSLQSTGEQSTTQPSAPVLTAEQRRALNWLNEQQTLHRSKACSFRSNPPAISALDWFVLQAKVELGILAQRVGLRLVLSDSSGRLNGPGGSEDYFYWTFDGPALDEKTMRMAAGVALMQLFRISEGDSHPSAHCFVFESTNADGSKTTRYVTADTDRNDDLQTQIHVTPPKPVYERRVVIQKWHEKRKAAVNRLEELRQSMNQPMDAQVIEAETKEWTELQAFLSDNMGPEWRNGRAPE